MAEQAKAARWGLQESNTEKDDRGTKSEPPVDNMGLRAREEVIKEKTATVARDVHRFHAFAAQRRKIDEHLGQADAKRTEGANENTRRAHKKGLQVKTMAETT
ncbi:uncharacterized protein PHALS_03949 [Plasmopara halstedii]|uniref:Uncharacterized protein n=1 Tax=Plasmopara halstedii TaxID=4781 RepID=A0A0P1AYX0_PLAHL|nr:uncharacterized protein PHALS_03949 [Plasmopara halstedii]CEG47294.1 hypothetical protein PHALS_03949 [Plasmopara halstedii]|eukprot:XP_024583663.1 hypothetical protein PHALS_03949 [Plasmopara halstedii]